MNYQSGRTSTADKSAAKNSCENSENELPVDPGKLGERTLEGIDSDNDGVRDDIQIWIHSKFKESPLKLMAYRQLAQDFQKEILSSNDKQLAILVSTQGLSSYECVLWFFR